MPVRLLSRLFAWLSAFVLAFAFMASPVENAAINAASAIHPTVSDYAFVSASTTPPTQAQCASVGRRCFTPQAIQAAYNLGPLYASGFNGAGMTIAIVDSYGSDTIAHDLHVFNQAFGLQPMCGEEGVTCAPGMPTFSQSSFQGSPATKAPPSQSKGTGLEDKSAWALEVSLDVETRARDRADGEHPARDDADGGDARRAGLPADDGGRAVRRRPPPRQRHLAELRAPPRRRSAVPSRC